MTYYEAIEKAYSGLVRIRHDGMKRTEHVFASQFLVVGEAHFQLIRCSRGALRPVYSEFWPTKADLAAEWEEVEE